MFRCKVTAVDVFAANSPKSAADMAEDFYLSTTPSWGGHDCVSNMEVISKEAEDGLFETRIIFDAEIAAESKAEAERVIERCYQGQGPSGDDGGLRVDFYQDERSGNE